MAEDDEMRRAGIVFDDPGSLQKWLDGKPADFARVLALRTALRVLPLWAQVFDSRSENLPHERKVELTLPVLRATFLSAVSLGESTAERKRLAARAARAAARAADAADAAAAAARAADAADAAAARAAARAADAADAAARAADAARAAARAADAAIWREIRRDALFLTNRAAQASEDGRGESSVRSSNATVEDAEAGDAGAAAIARELAATPLWTDRSPGWALEHRAKLGNALGGETGPWRHWLAWYDARLKGRPQGLHPRLTGKAAHEFDLRVATQENEWWDRGHEAVNADIVKWIEETKPPVAIAEFIRSFLREHHGSAFSAREIQVTLKNASYTDIGESLDLLLRRMVQKDEIAQVGYGLYATSESVAAILSRNAEPLEQDHAASAMATNAEGRVDLLPAALQDRLLDTPDQRADYDDVRKDALDLRARGQNTLGALYPQIEELLRAMPADFAAALVRPIWRTGNRLRRTYQAHQGVASFDEPHQDKLDPGVAEALGGLLDTFNNFAFSDPKIRARDERRVPPQERATLEEEKAIADPLVAKALEDDSLATDAARNEVLAEDRNAQAAPEIEHGAQARDQAARQRRNFFAAMISGAFALAKRFANASGAESKFAWKEIRATAYKRFADAGIILAGTEVVGVTAYHVKVLEFIAQNWQALKQYAIVAYQNPNVVAIIEWIAKIFQVS